MKTQLTNVRANSIRQLLAAGIALALALTLSCNVKDDGGDSGTFTDSRDGKKYKIVKIGEQTWMAENLNYNAEGSKYYEDKSENCQKYGRLYDWATAKTACPSGWHLPSDAEWQTLVDFAGGQDNNCPAGKNLKAVSGWDDYLVIAEEGSGLPDEGPFSGNGLDTHGFSALPGGACCQGCGDFDSDIFHLAGSSAEWWGGEIDASYASSLSVDPAFVGFYRDLTSSTIFGCLGSGISGNMHSIRCLKD